MDEKSLLTVRTDLMAHLPQSVPVVRLRVMGSSMGRLLQPGDRIECKPVIPRHIACGDIVVYRDRRQLVAHRVVQKIRNNRGCYFLTRGDSQLQSDGLVRGDQILGKVVAVLRKDGKRIDLSGANAIILNRIAGYYGRFLHDMMTSITLTNLRSMRFLPFPIHFKRLTQIPFQILSAWMK